MEVELTPDRRRCSHCNSSVCVSHTLSRSGSRTPHMHAREASEAEVGTDHSSGVEWAGGFGTRSPGKDK